MCKLEGGILAVLQQVTEETHGIYIDTDDLLSNNEKTGNSDDIHFWAKVCIFWAEDILSLLKDKKRGYLAGVI